VEIGSLEMEPLNFNRKDRYYIVEKKNNKEIHSAEKSE